MEKYKIVRFDSNRINLDVSVSSNEDTVWLSQAEIAILFDVDRSGFLDIFHEFIPTANLIRGQLMRKAHRFKWGVEGKFHGRFQYITLMSEYLRVKTLCGWP
jgi:hypothetical protein